MARAQEAGGQPVRSGETSGRSCELSIRLLGAFEVAISGRTAIDGAWPRKKAQSLIKLLALQPGRSMHRERVYELLWPELPESGGNNLHQTLTVIRRELHGEERELLSLQGDSAVLSPDAALDTDRFRAAAARAQADGSDAQLFEEALAIHSGDLLPEDLYEDWTEPHRSQLRQLRDRLLLGAALLYERSNAPDLAFDRLEQLLISEPTLEEAHRCLMRVHAQSGRRERALRQYEVLRATLERELGVQPSAETQQLVSSIGGQSGEAPRTLPRAPEPATKVSSEAGPPNVGLRRSARGRVGVALILVVGVAAAFIGGLFLDDVLAGRGGRGGVASSPHTLTFHQTGTGSANVVSGDCSSSPMVVDTNFGAPLQAGSAGKASRPAELCLTPPPISAGLATAIGASQSRVRAATRCQRKPAGSFP